MPFPPCPDCGRTYRFRFDKDYYSKGKPFCICEKKKVFLVGGIRTKEESVPADLVPVVIATFTEYGFSDVKVIPAEPAHDFPQGYKYLITASGHQSENVIGIMLNNKKGERSFVVSYAYGAAIIEHAPHDTWSSSGWNYVQMKQGSNSSLVYAVREWLERELPHKTFEKFSGTSWKKQVIYQGENLRSEQERKEKDDIASEKMDFRKLVSKINYEISERERANVNSRKEIEKLKAAYQDKFNEVF